MIFKFTIFKILRKYKILELRKCVLIKILFCYIFPILFIFESNYVQKILWSTQYNFKMTFFSPNFYLTNFLEYIVLRF